MKINRKSLCCSDRHWTDSSDLIIANSFQTGPSGGGRPSPAAAGSAFTSQSCCSSCLTVPTHFSLTTKTNEHLKVTVLNKTQLRQTSAHKLTKNTQFGNTSSSGRSWENTLLLSLVPNWRNYLSRSCWQSRSQMIAGVLFHPEGLFVFKCHFEEG